MRPKEKFILYLGTLFVNLKRLMGLVLETLNKAYMKLVWEMVEHQDTLWVQIMRAKYHYGSQVMPNIRSNNVSSTTCKAAVVEAWQLVKPNIKWIVKDGQDSRFWRINGFMI